MFSNLPQYRSEIEHFCALFPYWNSLESSRILITGGTGLIGTCLVDMIACHNEYTVNPIELYVLVRNRDKAVRRFNVNPDSTRLHFIIGDVSQSLPDLPDFDCIIHAGGNAHPGAFSSDPVGTMRSNLFGTDALLDHARKTCARSFLYVSTGEVYGSSTSSTPFVETYSGAIDITNPRSCYPSSKRAAETLCASYASEYDLNCVIVRPCHIYGPTYTDSDTRIASRFIIDALSGKDIVLKSTGSQVRSYCYTGDCAVGILTTLVKGERGNAYNISSRNTTVSIRDYAETIARECGVNLTMDLPSSAEKSAFNSMEWAVLDPSKLEGLGWKSTVDLASGIQRIISIRMMQNDR